MERLISFDATSIIADLIIDICMSDRANKALSHLLDLEKPLDRNLGSVCNTFHPFENRWRQPYVP